MSEDEEQVQGKRKERETTDDEDEQYRRVFNDYDKNGDGIISRDEFADTLRAAGHNPLEEELSEMIAEIDTNSDGEIDFKEFLHFAKCQNSQDDEDEALMEAFRVFDKDGSGFVDVEELRKGLEGRGEIFTPEEAEELLNEADMNGDGKIDYREFIRMMACHEVTDDS